MRTRPAASAVRVHEPEPPPTPIDLGASEVGDDHDSADLSDRLEETVERCAGLVRRIAGRHGLVGPEVDEVFQDVRIRLWKSLRTGEKIEKVPASYVYRTAVSAALDLIRRQRARKEEELDPTRSVPSTGTPHTELESQETMRIVATAIDGIIESRRAVVRMYLAGYKLEEIADLMGWTSDKTRNLLYRGLADLRAALLDAGLGPGVAE